MDKSRSRKKDTKTNSNQKAPRGRGRSKRNDDGASSSDDDPDYKPEEKRKTRQTTALEEKSQKFLGKKKADIKFKTAGPGHKLTGNESQPDTGRTLGGRSVGSGGGHPSTAPGPAGKSGGPKPGAVPSEEKRQAAAAALARLEKQKKPTEVNEKDRLAARQLAFIKEQARREIEAEMKAKESGQAAHTEERKPEVDAEIKNYEERVIDPANYAVKGVYYTCPIVGPDVGSKEEIEQKIKEFLREQPDDEIAVTSCLMIHSCNKPREKVNTCVDILCKYIDNIIQNPDNPKVRKIRLANKAYQDKVAVVEGATHFIRAAGFAKSRVKNDDTRETEEVWIFLSDESVSEEDIERITDLRDTLKKTTPIRPELDRNVQVLMPAEVKQRKELPAEFYQLTLAELKREQQLKTELAERELQLRTKAQREKDELRERRMYRYCVMRIRFPDGFTLQGTFWAHEKMSDLYDFVRENLIIEDLDFHLRLRGEALPPTDVTFAENKLAPASLLNFQAENPPPALASGEVSYLKPDILSLVKSME